MLFCVACHFTALRSWFCNDDFAWLGLPLLVDSWRDLPHVLLAPMAQGTIRVFSERLFFLGLGSVFDLNIVPFKIVVFLTQFANLALIMWITRRLTGGATAARVDARPALAGFLAPILWCAGIALAEPLAWASAYNEVLIAFCVLLGFFFRLKWIESGERKYRYLEWAPFLFGFGVLETIVIYPVLMLWYALCCAPKTLRSTLPLFAPAVLFTIFHFTAIAPSTDPKYTLSFAPAGLVYSLWTYWALAAGTLRMDIREPLPAYLLAGVSLALLVFAAKKLSQGQRLALFLLLWFPLALSPVLPLGMHISDYYLTVPTIGLAMLAAWAASVPNRWASVAAVFLIPVFLFCSIAQAHALESTRFERGRLMRHFLRDMRAHESEYEDKVVLLQGMRDEFFWAGILDRPLSLIGIPNVYVTPDSALPVWMHEWADASNLAISWQDAYDMVMHGKAVVFSVAGRPANITAFYKRDLTVQQVVRSADLMNVADASAAGRLGEGWYPVEGSTRWMGRQASFWMTSARPKQRLYMRGYCPESLLQAGPLDLTVAVDGQPIATFPISHSNWFTFDAPLPEQLSGKGRVDVHLRVSRSYRPPNDGRELGLIFATFTVQE
jgi:hypothetical protein